MAGTGRCCWLIVFRVVASPSSGPELLVLATRAWLLV